MCNFTDIIKLVTARFISKLGRNFNFVGGVSVTTLGRGGKEGGEGTDICTNRCMLIKILDPFPRVFQPAVCLHMKVHTAPINSRPTFCSHVLTSLTHIQNSDVA